MNLFKGSFCKKKRKNFSSPVSFLLPTQPSPPSSSLSLLSLRGTIGPTSPYRPIPPLPLTSRWTPPVGVIPTSSRSPPPHPTLLVPPVACVPAAARLPPRPSPPSMPPSMPPQSPRLPSSSASNGHHHLGLHGRPLEFRHLPFPAFPLSPSLQGRI